MRLIVPVPRETFDVDRRMVPKFGVRRHGNPDGTRLTVTHGNGFAADGYLPFWELLTPKYDVLVFDFRNHGQNIPVEPANHNYAQLSRDLERIRRQSTHSLGRKTTAGIFHSMSARAAMKHALEIGWRWDALILFDPPNVPPAIIRATPQWRCSRTGSRVGARPPPPLCRGRGAGGRISAIACRPGLGGRRARADGALGAAPEPRRRRYRAHLRAGKRSRDLCRGPDANLWPRAAEFGGPVKLIGADPGMKGRRRPRPPTRRSASSTATTTARARHRSSLADREAGRVRAPRRGFSGEVQDQIGR